MRWLILSLLLFTTAAVAGEPPLPGPVPARVVRVIDGDTIEVAARIWLRQYVTVSVRLAGIDAPELKGKCQSEIDRATAAKLAAMGLAKVGAIVGLWDVTEDKYSGRVVARVVLPDGRDLGDVLKERGLVRHYTGGPRGSWCP